MALTLLAAPARAAEPVKAADLPNSVLSPMDTIRLITTERGKVVVVNFFASWCPPCRREIPYLQELRDKYPEDQFELIGISLDDSHQAYAQFVENMEINYTTYRAGAGVQEAFKINGIPVMLYYGRDGKLAERVVGLHSKEAMIAHIDRLLKESN